MACGPHTGCPLMGDAELLFQALSTGGTVAVTAAGGLKAIAKGGALSSPDRM